MSDAKSLANELASELWDAAIEEIDKCRHVAKRVIVMAHDHKRGCDRIESVLAPHLRTEAEDRLIAAAKKWAMGNPPWDHKHNPIELELSLAARAVAGAQ